MHPDLRPAYDALEQQKNDLLAEIATLTPAQRSFRPDPGSWSILQVADHLARSEKEVLAILRKGLPENRKHRTLKDRIAYFAVLGLMASPIRVKAPIKAILPPDDLELEGVTADWDAIRDELAEELAKIDDLTSPIIAHPIAGPAAPRQTLKFLGAHIGHHERQVRRIRGHRGFPAGT